jgi:hypothetical protein
VAVSGEETAITTRAILNGDRAIRLIAHRSDGWQFLDREPVDCRDMAIVQFAHLLDDHPELAAQLDLPKVGRLGEKASPTSGRGLRSLRIWRRPSIIASLTGARDATSAPNCRFVAGIGAPQPASVTPHRVCVRRHHAR